jgi:GxxExxY protein
MGNALSMNENQLSGISVDCLFKVHKNLGPGLLESAYEICFMYELKKAGLEAKSQVALPVVYGDIKLDAGYRIDVLIEDKLLVEIKAVEALNDVHLAQVLTYLKLSNIKLGLLVNFNVALIKNGTRRVVNNL